MPSSSDPQRSSILRQQVKAWQPEDFQAITPSAGAIESVIPLREESASPDFVELVEIVREKIALESRPAEQVFPSAAAGEVRPWQPQKLVPLENVKGDTHDALRSRELLQQAEETLRRAKEEAQSIVAQAQAEAQRLLNEAREQATVIQRQAYADGQASANAEAQGMLQAARAVVAEVQKWKENLFEEGEMMMLRLVIEIAQTIFGDGLPLDPDTLGQAFTRALSQAKSLGDLRIYLHPQDAAVLSAHWDKLQGVAAGQKIELIPSDLIKRGGCYIEGQYGSVDARVETQFQLATDALLTTLEKSRTG
jgi:flagellar assembly protein FliH